MTAQPHATSGSAIERPFTAVRAALPAVNMAAFDAELAQIARAPVVDLTMLDDFLTGWWCIAIRAAQDSQDWQRMHAEAEQIQFGHRSTGVPLAEVLARRGDQI
ncbi:putative dithiol-disulfide oxidoreductase (DUF899 family) [Streptosporangium album]|uniref:Putative dithiol-disulfide oxidoreductase (DUF899 family) n=1 Tax=Streptosporangium album TaxID=47479 RepID=A0A7W7S252_9ACTN|nr:DUF6247 family protein [Streptosporangium album]MBB4942490.1 putative dithiol-disulfide oxidoreductase (DUF899 family) [Streptosporangium album]